MSAITGAVQRLYHQDSGAVSKTQFLLLTGGEIVADPQTQEVRALNAWVARGGLFLPRVQAQGVPTADTKTFLSTYGQHSSYPTGAPGEIAGSGGVVIAGDSNAYWTLGTPRVDEWELSGRSAAEGGDVECSITIGGMTGARTSSAVPAPDAMSNTAPMEIFDSSLTVGGSAYGPLEWRLRVNNAIRRRTNFDAKSTGAKRLPNTELIGREKYELEVATESPIALDLDADVLGVAVAAILTLSDGTNTWTLTLSGSMAPREINVGFVGPDDDVQYRQRFFAEASSAALLTQT